MIDISDNLIKFTRILSFIKDRKNTELPSNAYSPLKLIARLTYASDLRKII